MSIRESHVNRPCVRRPLHRCGQKGYRNLEVPEQAGRQAKKVRGVRVATAVGWNARQHVEDPRAVAHGVRRREDQHQLRVLVSDPKLHGCVDDQFAHALPRGRPVAPHRGLREQTDGRLDVASPRRLHGDLQHVAHAGGIGGYGEVEHRADERRAVALGGAQLQTLGLRHQPRDDPLTTTLESQLGRVE